MPNWWDDNDQAEDISWVYCSFTIGDNGALPEPLLVLVLRVSVTPWFVRID